MDAGARRAPVPAPLARLCKRLNRRRGAVREDAARVWASWIAGDAAGSTTAARVGVRVPAFMAAEAKKGGLSRREVMARYGPVRAVLATVDGLADEAAARVEREAADGSWPAAPDADGPDAVRRAVVDAHAQWVREAQRAPSAACVRPAPLPRETRRAAALALAAALASARARLAGELFGRVLRWAGGDELLPRRGLGALLPGWARWLTQRGRAPPASAAEAFDGYEERVQALRTLVRLFAVHNRGVADPKRPLVFAVPAPAPGDAVDGPFAQRAFHEANPVEEPLSLYGVSVPGEGTVYQW